MCTSNSSAGPKGYVREGWKILWRIKLSLIGTGPSEYETLVNSGRDVGGGKRGHTVVLFKNTVHEHGQKGKLEPHLEGPHASTRDF